jgi:glycine betaine/proline transport system permease protein
MGGLHMEWLTETKIPIGKTAKTVFEWLQDNGAWFFDGLAEWLEALID